MCVCVLPVGLMFTRTTFKLCFALAVVLLMTTTTSCKLRLVVLGDNVCLSASIIATNLLKPPDMSTCQQSISCVQVGSGLLLLPKH